MHLTTEEVALASVAIGGLIGALGTTARDRSTERREHSKRLWEKEVEIYESLILTSNSIAYTYRMMTFALENPEYLYDKEFWQARREATPDSTDQKPSASLVMYGRPEVKTAYEEFMRKHEEAMLYFLNNGIEVLDKSSDSSAREGMIKTVDAAWKAQERLVTVIATAVRSVPTERRNIFSRLAHPRRHAS